MLSAAGPPIIFQLPSCFPPHVSGMQTRPFSARNISAKNDESTLGNGNTWYHESELQISVRTATFRGKSEGFFSEIK